MTGHFPASTLNQLLDAAPARPTDEAVFDGTDRLTWQEYRAAAAGLAGRLVASGVGPGDRVGVHLPKSVRSFVAVHAVLRCGAVMVPIDRSAPTAHVGDVVSDAGARVVISDSSDGGLESLAGGIGSRVELIDPHDREAGIEPVDVAPDAPAYIIYTSGSTGRPKGILHTHFSGLAYARRAAATYGLSRTDRLANFAPLHFDQSTFELYAAPFAGASVVVVPDPVLRFPASLASLVLGERCSVWYTVPYAITQLVERGGLDRHDTGCVRWVLFGGESFEPSDLVAAMRALPSARFSNVYGPAEVNQCTYRHLDDADEVEGPVPIGRPWAGTAVRITGDGVTGELLVATDTMMDRYWQRPELTGTAIETVGVGPAATRWYRTGDVVTTRDDGELVFQGRVDHQVKVRGHRIELEAVDLAISGDPSVEAAASVVDGDRLVAFVMPPPDRDVRRALVQRLRDVLPPAAVPDEIVGVESLPRTGTGKTDRRAVAAMLAARSADPTTPPTAPLD